ncbi:MAG: hypothetical protein HQK55_06180 [Deltaproteobacteria bacterium]|nr:hypothetical protein [Deltaproteobacteria bacterium]
MTNIAENFVPSPAAIVTPAVTTNPQLDDPFLAWEDLTPSIQESARNSLKAYLAEMDELGRENRWSDVLALFWPVEEKLPELAAAGLDLPIRAKLGFALGQLHRFDEAITELTICVDREPQDHMYQGSLAYTAYNSLFAAKNKEIFLSGHPRQERIDLAHTHFQKAQSLCPDRVTNFYREGMLYRKVEGKPEQAVPLSQTAVANWDNLDAEQKKHRHQERKNFVKALYNLPSTFLELESPHKSLALLERCLKEDETSHYMSDWFQYFALGKVTYQLGRFPASRDALIYAAQIKDAGPRDFVFELLARTELALGQPEQALAAINQIPERKRRPYYRWTEADVWCAFKDFSRARTVLLACQERDSRSKHVALIRLTKIDYLLGDFQNAFEHAQQANQFFLERFGNPYGVALFWQALTALRLNRQDQARALALELKDFNPRFPKLERLLHEIG